jgi:hypothetical protein
MCLFCATNLFDAYVLSHPLQHSLCRTLRSVYDRFVKVAKVLSASAITVARAIGQRHAQCAQARAVATRWHFATVWLLSHALLWDTHDIPEMGLVGHSVPPPPTPTTTHPTPPRGRNGCMQRMACSVTHRQPPNR